jgi:hypothetical protein
MVAFVRRQPGGFKTMGAWGTAIFSDDTACDIRDEWRDAILEGLGAEEATARLIASFDGWLNENASRRLFWMALAAAQMETGRLLPDVRDRALKIIDSGGDIDRWHEDGDESLAKQRARVLERLAAKLRGPQPKPKRLRRPVALLVPLDVGDVVLVRARDDEERNVLVLVVAQHRETRNEIDPVVVPLDWIGERLPTIAQLSRLALLPDPISPGEPLAIVVITPTKKDIFGSELGEVVARNVRRPDVVVDPGHVSHYMGWRVIPASVAEARLMARYRASGGD